MLQLGLRISEVCGLQWGDIDLNNREIHICRGVRRISDGSGKPFYLYNHQKQKLLIGYYQFPSGLVNFFLPYIRRKSAKILSGFCLARKRGPLSRDATGKAFIAILQRLVCMT